MTLFANLAVSLDGKIAPEKIAEGSFTSRLDRSRMRILRAQADAVLVGAETLRQANPPLGIESAEAVARRREAGRPEQPAAVVITQSGRGLASASRFWSHRGRKIVLTTAEGREEILPLANHHGAEVKIVGASEGALDPEVMLDALNREGLNHLLLEGGGATLSAFVRQHLVDQLFVTLAPCLLGGQKAPSLFGGPGLPLTERIQLRLLRAETIENEVFLVYGFAPLTDR